MICRRSLRDRLLLFASNVFLATDYPILNPKKIEMGSCFLIFFYVSISLINRY